MASTGALKTLHSWGDPMLETIRLHIFFGDQMFQVEPAAEMGTVACHVSYGIAQRVTKKGAKETRLVPK